MVQHDIWSIPNVQKIVEEAKAAVTTKLGKTEEEMEVRLFRADDWDSFNAVAIGESVYSETYIAGDNTFLLDIKLPYAVVFIGHLDPDLGSDINHGEAWVGDKKVREYPGSLIYLQENGIFIAFDPFFTMEKKKFRVIISCDTGFVAEDFPLVIGIFPK